MKWNETESARLVALKSRIGQVTSDSLRKPDQEGRFAICHPAAVRSPHHHAMNATCAGRVPGAPWPPGTRHHKCLFREPARNSRDGGYNIKNRVPTFS